MIVLQMRRDKLLVVFWSELRFVVERRRNVGEIGAELMDEQDFAGGGEKSQNETVRAQLQVL